MTRMNPRLNYPHSVDYVEMFWVEMSAKLNQADEKFLSLCRVLTQKTGSAWEFSPFQIFSKSLILVKIIFTLCQPNLEISITANLRLQLCVFCWMEGTKFSVRCTLACAVKELALRLESTWKKYTDDLIETFFGWFKLTNNKKGSRKPSKTIFEERNEE